MIRKLSVDEKINEAIAYLCQKQSLVFRDEVRKEIREFDMLPEPSIFKLVIEKWIELAGKG